MSKYDARFLPTGAIQAVTTLEQAGKSGYDCVLIVTHDAKDLSQYPSLTPILNTVQEYIKLDSGATTGVSVLLAGSPIKRIVLSCTGPTNRDYDDVRSFKDAAEKGMKRALSAGARRPLLVTTPCGRFPEAELVSLLGVLYVLHVPLEIRELTDGGTKNKADALGVLYLTDTTALQEMIRRAEAIESGRCVSRDIMAADPERMTPPKSAEYVTFAFGQPKSAVKVTVIDNQKVIEKEYPCMAAVTRCADTVERHRARLIELEYTGEGKPNETLMFVGKGVTIDTGGANLKVGDAMWGMSRDKGGAATVAGFFKVLDCLRPRNLRAVAYLCMVRNSIGANAYTCDEIVTARSGQRVRVVNTDAEGRMIMVDPLCQMKQRAAKEVNPHLFTVATLTGHACLAYGDGYTITVDNGPSRTYGTPANLQKVGDQFGDTFEMSRLQREDYVFHKAESEYADLRQANTKPTSQTPRGHITPAAFLIMGSGLDKHGNDSTRPLRYSHIDMANGDGPFPGVPFGGPVIALAANYILPNL